MKEVRGNNEKRDLRLWFGERAEVERSIATIPELWVGVT